MSLNGHEQAARLGLSAEDYNALCEVLGRAPNITELGVTSAMWSEHCSYRSSKEHLARIFTQGAQVVEGPGENAGVIDIGDNQVAVFKMESHNHPSFLEPYQGAATGVGGIMRDIFTMGARPIAFLNALRFGAPEHSKTRFLLEGVVSGIGGYGNCVGVPTLGGEVDFDSSYNGNILVNAMCVGIAERDKIFRSRLEEGCALLYVGARTGRDGIQGAVMASASFEGDEASRTSVQIGDPFMQKLLLECCLEMMTSGSIIGLQDMGAAGLTSSSVEMAEKSGCGIELDLDKVPCREDNMSAYEMMLSESQERMLIAIRPEAEAEIKAICDKWELSCFVIGKATHSHQLIVKHQGKIEAELPIAMLVSGAPPVKREVAVARAAEKKNLAPAIQTPFDVLLRLLNTPELCSKRWVSEQYDQSVMGDSLLVSGGDGALVRVHNERKALALVCECTPRYCLADSFAGAEQAVAEAFRNISALGAKPLAITNCLNFASPEKPEVMGQFSAAIDGMSAAARALDMPVVSGNVSFYNETDGRAIMPTPTIGAVGLIEDYRLAVSLTLKQAGLELFLLGAAPKEFSGMTLYQKYILEDKTICAPPKVCLAKELKNGIFVREQIGARLIKAAHDVGSGGLAVALAEMAIASRAGIKLECDSSHIFLFDEAQARYIIACEPKAVAKLEAAAGRASVALTRLGSSGGAALSLSSSSVDISVLESAYEQFIPNLMEQ